jgi:hypothetical protein
MKKTLIDEKIYGVFRIRMVITGNIKVSYDA